MQVLVCQFPHETSYHMICNENIHFCIFFNLFGLLKTWSVYFCIMIWICSTFSQIAHTLTFMITNLWLRYFFLYYTRRTKTKFSCLSKWLRGESYRFEIFSKQFDPRDYKRKCDCEGVCSISNCRKMLIKTLMGLASMGLWRLLKLEFVTKLFGWALKIMLCKSFFYFILFCAKCL